jgi:hypothetical protein
MAPNTFDICLKLSFLPTLALRRGYLVSSTYPSRVAYRSARYHLANLISKQLHLIARILIHGTLLDVSRPHILASLRTW